MTDYKLARGMAREHRHRAYTKVRQREKQFAEIINRHGTRLVDGSRLKPGQPGALMRELLTTAESESAAVLLRHVETLQHGKEARIQLATLRPSVRFIGGVEEKSYEFVAESVTADRRRIKCYRSFGFISIFEHAYDRYLSREGGKDLQDFRADFWDHGARLAIPFLLHPAEADGMPVFLPCGRGLLAGFRRTMPVEDLPPVYRMTLDHNGPCSYRMHHELVDIDAVFYPMLDLRTFIAFEGLREEKEELFHALSELVAEHAEILELARGAGLLVGLSRDHEVTLDDMREDLEDVIEDLDEILRRPRIARMIEAARKADPYASGGRNGSAGEELAPTT